MPHPNFPRLPCRSGSCGDLCLPHLIFQPPRCLWCFWSCCGHGSPGPRVSRSSSVWMAWQQPKQKREASAKSPRSMLLSARNNSVCGLCKWHVNHNLVPAFLALSWIMDTIRDRKVLTLASVSWGVWLVKGIWMDIKEIEWDAILNSESGEFNHRRIEKLFSSSVNGEKEWLSCWNENAWFLTIPIPVILKCLLISVWQRR